MLTNKWEQVPEKAKEIPEVSMERLMTSEQEGVIWISWKRF